MLCTRPYLEYRETQRIKEQGYQGISNGGHGNSSGDLTSQETDDEDGHGNGHAVAQQEEGEAHEEHDMGEIIIHQVIREFCALISSVLMRN